MRIKIAGVLMMILYLGLMAGCGDDDSPSDPTGGGQPGIQSGTITATVSGQAKDFSKGSAGVIGGGTAAISGTNQASTENLVLEVAHANGTYDIAAQDGPAITLVHNSAGWFAVSGTVTVTTASSTRLVGTFSGTFNDFQATPLTVVDGVIDVPLAAAP